MSFASFNLTATAIRKANAGKQFNREYASRQLNALVHNFWADGLAAMFSYLGYHGGWEKIQRHVQISGAADYFAKSLSASDRQFLEALLNNFTYFNDAALKSAALIRATTFDTFEEAARFALGQIGVDASQFQLNNPRLQELLLLRKDTALFATRAYRDDVFDTIIKNFAELGQHPYSSAFVEQLQSELGNKTAWEAKRFALTETGIAAELAQAETYRRNGVGAKQWNATGVNTRETHLDLNGDIRPIDTPFNVGGSPADHPLDPDLPPEELINCHCWLSPVVDENFAVDPNRIWEGQ